MGYTVLKVPLKIIMTTIEISEGYEILCVQVENNEPYVRIKIKSNQTKQEKILIGIYGTGWTMRDGKYIGTFQLNNGEVFDVFQHME